MSECKTVFPVLKPVTIAIHGKKERFPVGRIFCIGRNYQEHAAEMNYEPVDKSQTDPIFFIKSACHVAHTNAQETLRVPYPLGTSNLHHEVELVLAFGKDLDAGAGAGQGADVAAGMGAAGADVAAGVGSELSKERILDAIYGYAVGLDMTRRDLQSVAKKNGFPWDGAKDFADSVILGELTEKTALANPWMDNVGIKLTVNEEVRQDGNTSDLIWTIDECIAYLAKFYDFKAGDLVMTGTPSGVGPVVRGDKLHGSVEGLQDLRVEYF